MVKFRGMIAGAHLDYKELRETNKDAVNGVFSRIPATLESQAMVGFSGSRALMKSPGNGICSWGI